MGWYIPRFLQFPGYETRDVKEDHKKMVIEIVLRRKDDKCFQCHRCGEELKNRLKEYPMRIRSLPLMEFACFINLKRLCGHCPRCKKTRAERIDFLSVESPHLTQDFAWALGKLCEISAVTNAAEYNNVEAMTAWRIDFKRMQLMMRYYKIPKVTHISVDEVYAKRTQKEGESRDDKFFTVVTDLKTRRVIWVSQSRRKEALDEFFQIIGPEACEEIKVVAADQHEAYRASTTEYCKNAKLVWDRFHIMKSFNDVINEMRKETFELARKDDPSRRYLQGKYRYLFLKKSSRRTKNEQQHIDEATKTNKHLMKTELIKERLFTFFDAQSPEEGGAIFEEIGKWIYAIGYGPLKDWWERLLANWTTLKNYFEFKVTTSLSEGINNVIKALKRAAYGYKNMTYFRLKIMQKCGYLNSKYIPNINFLLADL